MQTTALVLGATGGFGAAVTQSLIKAGWHVRALHRDLENVSIKGRTASRIEWVAGDAMNETDVRHAAQGARVIVHAVNPPGYRNWDTKAVPMLANTIAAAKAGDARILFPGNIYNYGHDAGHLLSENDPQNPVSRKGDVRVRMEQMLAEATDEGVRTIILRAGDYFGPHAPGSWLTNGMIRPGKRVRSVYYPGKFGLGHSWAYLPDLAEAATALIECEGDLPDFDSFHFEGHYVERGEEFAETVAKLAGDAPVRKLPWAMLQIGGLFSATLREASEMRYLWETPHRLDGSKLKALMGDEPRTPLRAALHETLDGLACLDRVPGKRKRSPGRTLSPTR